MIELGEDKRLAFPTAPSPTTTPFISLEPVSQQQLGDKRLTFNRLHYREDSQERSRRVRESLGGLEGRLNQLSERGGE